MDKIVQFVRGRRGEMLKSLEEMVRIESPSRDMAAVNRCVEYVVSQVEKINARIKRYRVAGFGDHLQIDIGPPARGHGRLLVLGHLDTVWDVGTIKHMPFRISRGRVYGPGVLDMKGGVVAILFALQAIQGTKSRLPKHTTILLTSDEEVGSRSSRPVVEALASTSEVALVMEPGNGLSGALKTSRKGTGWYTVSTYGKSAHAGTEFEKGVNAIVELAHQIRSITNFTSPKRGVTVSVGVIGGGTLTNVIPDKAWAKVDIRVASMAGLRYLERRFSGLRPIHPDTKIDIEGGINRPPMERTVALGQLFRRAQEVSRPLGIELRESSTGGGSDGNFTAAMGVPTLDGLGVVGEGAHGMNEHMILDQFPLRTALLAHLLLSL